MGAMGSGSLGPAMGSNLSQEFPFVPDGQTIAEMPMSGHEINEWANAEATVVQPANGRQTPPPQVHVTTPPHRPLRPPTAADGSTSDLYISPMATPTPGVYDDGITSSRPVWLIPALLILGVLLVGGGMFAFNNDSQANQADTTTQNDQSVANKAGDTSTASDTTPEDEPKETSPSKANDKPDEKVEKDEKDDKVEEKPKKDEKVEETAPEKDNKTSKKTTKKTTSSSKKSTNKTSKSTKTKKTEPKKEKDSGSGIESLSLPVDGEKDKKTESNVPRLNL